MEKREIAYHAGVVHRLVGLYFKTQEKMENVKAPTTESEWNNLMELVLKDMQDELFSSTP